MDDLDLGATIKGFAPGQKVFKRYALKRILGRGGMGVVWLARDEDLEIDIALKFLPEIVALDKESLSELKRETRRNLALTHPHIVRVYDFVQGPNAAAISMEYIDGASLSALKVDQPGHVFPLERIRPWIEQLCTALDYAHRSARIVHRDLKPANLMINTRDELKVTDFGIARSVADSVSRVSAQAGGSSGTPVYMSPQQMMGEDPAVTDDIYAVGATIYELLTGKPPFHSGNILLQVQTKVPAPVNERRATLGIEGPPVPAALEAALAACLAKTAADRPQSAAELAKLLFSTETVTRTPSPAAQPETPKPAQSAPVATTAADPRPVATPVRKSKPPLIAALVAGVIALGGLGWYYGMVVPERERVATEQKAAAEQAAAKAESERLARLAREEEAREAEAAKEAERARLAALRLPVTLRTEPAGAELIVDGQSRGASPVSGLGLALGEHQVLARKADHEDLAYTLVIVEQGQTEWTLPLARSTGLVTVTAQPESGRYRLVPVDERGVLATFEKYGGELPVKELKVETGRYELRVTPEPAIAGVEHRQFITVRKGETVTPAADIRGGKLEIKSTPAGATVLLDGRAQGQTPLALSRQPFGQPLQVELQLEGYLPQKKTVQFSQTTPAEIWNTALKEVPRVVSRPSFQNGPKNIEVTARVQGTTNTQSTTNGQTTKSGPNATNLTISSQYEIKDWDADGFIRTADSVPSASSGDAKVYRPGSQVRFDRAGPRWSASFLSGGFEQAAMDASILSPSYPGMWLSHEVLPGGDLEKGRTWSVPLSAASTLFPSIHLVGPTGSIRGRITATDPDAGWVDLVYEFDLSGQMMPMMKQSMYSLVMQGRFTGTMILRLNASAGWVSAATIRMNSTIESTMKPQQGGNVRSEAALMAAVAAATATTSIAQSDMTTEITVQPISSVQKPVVADNRPARVIFYRPGRLQGIANNIRVDAAGQRIAEVPNKGTAEATFPPGVVTLTASSWGGAKGIAPLELTLAPGEVCYVRLAFGNKSMLLVGIELERVDEATARAAMAGLKGAAVEGG